LCSCKNSLKYALPTVLPHSRLSD